MLTISKKSTGHCTQNIRKSHCCRIFDSINLLDDDYLLRHSIETCALSLLVAGALDLDNIELYNIGTAAILHDIGLCKMPHLIHNSNMQPHERNCGLNILSMATILQKESGYPGHF